MKQFTVFLFVAACVLAVAFAYPAETEDESIGDGARVRRSPQYYGGYGGGYNRGYGGYGGGYNRGFNGYGGNYGGRGYNGYGYGRGYGGRGYNGYGSYGGYYG